VGFPPSPPSFSNRLELHRADPPAGRSRFDAPEAQGISDHGDRTDRKDFEPVVQIAPEELVAHHLRQIAVCRGDQPDISRNRPGAASRSNALSCRARSSVG